MATCHISISRISPGLYELRVKTPGSTGPGRRLTRTLPPDFSDFLVAAPSGRPARKWRRPPTGAGNEDLLFWAGDLATLKEIGGRLYESLFLGGPEDVREDGDDFTTAFLTARGMAAEKGGLGLEIDLSEAPELSRIPWEALYLAPQDLLLGIDSRTNVVRRLEWDSPPPAMIQPPIRMLVAVANPDSALESGIEIGDIERRLVNLLREDETSYEIAKLPHATRIALQDKIEAWKPHVIHFIGHGGFDDEQGLIYLHSGTNPGARDAIDSATLRDLIGESPPWLVVLNSCLSGAAAKADPFAGAAQNLIRANVPFVVAMQTSISDDAAIRFSRRFYAALASGEPVATAVTRGRNGIRTLEDQGLQAELITPVLYTNGKAKEIAIAAVAASEPEPAAVAGTTGWARIERGILVLAAIAAIVSVPIAIYAVWDDDAPVGDRNVIRDEVAAMVQGERIEDRVQNESVSYGAPGQGDSFAPDIEPLPPAATAATPAPGIPGGVYVGSVPHEPGRRPRRAAPPVRTPPRGPSGAAPDHAQSLPPRTGPDITPTATAAAPPPWEAAIVRRQREMERRRRAASSSRYAFIGSYFRAPQIASRGINRERRSSYDYGTIVDADTVAISAAGERAMLLPSGAYGGGDVVATFAAGSSAVALIEIERPAAVLASPLFGAVAIELVGNTDPRETLIHDEGLGLARAERVAAALRDRGVAAGRLVTASAADRWSHSAFDRGEIEWARNVEARLVLSGAERIAFASDSAEAPSGDPGLLDRVAQFARENPRFWIRLEGHADATETQPFALSGRRIDSVRAQLVERGIAPSRLQAHLFGDSHPELVGATGPDANRRVQLVLVPPFGPEPVRPSAPPVTSVQP